MSAKNITGSEEMWEAAIELANSNTGGNVSALLGRLAAQMYFEPSIFNLRSAADEKEKESFVAKDSRGHVRKNISMDDVNWTRLQRLANSNTAGNISRLFQYVIPLVSEHPTTYHLLSPSDEELPEPDLPTVAQEFRHKG